MSRDIRSYFTVQSKKPNTDTASNSSSPSPRQIKRKRRILDYSDDEDVIESTPDTKRTTSNKRNKIIVSSDSKDDQKAKTTKPTKTEKTGKETNLKAVNIDDVFKKTPIKQSKVESVTKPEPETNQTTKEKKTKKSKKTTEIEVHKDTDFAQTLLELDDDNDILAENVEILDKTIDDAIQEEKNNQENKSPPSSSKNRSRNNSTNSDSASKKKKEKFEHTDSGIDPGQEAHEKRRYSAMLYQKYLQRTGPKHHGEKEIPKGKPDCLKNLVFLRTGVLDSLDSNEFEDLIKTHGGRVVHAVSKKVNYVVVGDDPGPSKLAKAQDYKIPEITEDELLDLILTKSGMEAKYCKKSEKQLSEDQGIGDEIQQIAQIEQLKDDNKMEIVEDRESVKKEKKPVEKKEEIPIEPPIKEPQKSIIIDDNQSLTDKYRPQTLQSIIGQQDTNSCMFRLKRWLENWYRNQQSDIKKTIKRPSPWTKNDDGAYFKCALLSGPPGVGKTTTATLVAKELNFDIVEFNASDTRSKRLLHEEVAQLLSTNTIAGFATGQKTVNKKRVLIMDEVDGMAGNEDRGGIQELIQLIKTTHIPIICMCNDRNHQKMRSLVNYCFDLRFNKPRLEQIRGAMMTVCFKEGIKITPNTLTEIINGTNCDVRQTLNNLNLWSITDKSITQDVAEKQAKNAKKDTVIGPWEVVRKVFTKSEHKDLSIADKARLFFYDYSLGPLFVQENYLKVQPECDKASVLKRIAATADSISMGDTIDALIRSTNNWSLLESQAMFSSVFPGYFMSGHFIDRIDFPAWLGKNSTKNKLNRIANEIQTHIRLTTSASTLAVKLDYLIPLRNAIVQPLTEGVSGVNKAVDVMKCYNLLREDLDGLIQLSQWSTSFSNPYSNIDSKVKAAFTRNYNKHIPLLPYAPQTGLSKKKSKSPDDEIDEESEIEENDDDIGTDALIKVKEKKIEKPTTSKRVESKGGKRGRKK